jgi:hypothetical protein
MHTKLTSPDQIGFLQEGDIIERFPCNCSDGPMAEFDGSRLKNIIRYEIKSINHKNGMFLLKTANYRTLLFAAPVDIGRLFISDTDLIDEKVWWINS